MKKLSLIATVAMAAVACNTTNPLIEGWDTPYGIPDFGAVKEKHYIPALEAGIAQQQAEIDAIIANEEAPTFANVFRECFFISEDIILICIQHC